MNASTPSPQAKPAAHDTGPWFPQELHDDETKQIGHRQKKDHPVPIAETVGVALSGGGIRSATFCLGVFQSLAKLGLLNKIDYLSTVSGGGYFGGFLGRMYVRPWITGKQLPPTPRQKNSPCANPEEFPPGASKLSGLPPGVSRVEYILKNPQSAPIKWLRDNGRYLSPNGSGDTWLALAAVLRNWVAVQVVMATLIFVLFLTVDLLRAECWKKCHSSSMPLLERYFLELTKRHEVWWSPTICLVLIPLILGVVPFGWAYWFTQGNDKSLGRYHRLPPWLVALLLSIVCFVVAVCVPQLADYRCPLFVLGGSGLLALLVWCVNKCCPNHDWSDQAKLRDLRNRLSSGLATTLGLTLAVLAFAFVDSMGQTAYAVFKVNTGPLMWKAIGAATGVTTLLSLGKPILFALEKLPKSKAVRMPLDALAAIAAACVLFMVLTALAAVSYGIAWGFKTPQPEVGLNPGSNIVAQVTPKDKVSLSPENHIMVVDNSLEGKPSTFQRRMLGGPLLAALLLAVLLSLAFGSILQFLNLSSHQALYSARLARAYLGASNPNRWKPAGQKLSDVMECDDITWHEYRPQDAGGPLHLINVTLNETVSGKSQIEFRDRKGLSMAIGPCGISVGVSDHGLWTKPMSEPKIEPIGLEKNKFHALGVITHPVETLPLSNWIGISGAAFTTGLGAGTSLGKSMLLGIANIRLGYWWNCGITHRQRSHDPTRTKPSLMARFGEHLSGILIVQMHLLDEFLARFHGPSRQRWYISDGGHFENTACYELIRRRVPFIIAVDAGQDLNYEFTDLANLVRLVRTDFQAEVDFFRRRAPTKEIQQAPKCPLPFLDDLVNPELVSLIGTTEDFHPDDEEDADLPSRHARAHALLARVSYPDGHPSSFILFLKPSLTGDEPLDVLQYNCSHPDFPQETTADQYFDEAQWESYRKLGEHIGTLLFTNKDGKWSPGKLQPPPTV